MDLLVVQNTLLWLVFETFKHTNLQILIYPMLRGANKNSQESTNWKPIEVSKCIRLDLFTNMV